MGVGKEGFIERGVFKLNHKQKRVTEQARGGRNNADENRASERHVSESPVDN